jgi:hypothetical protein
LEKAPTSIPTPHHDNTQQDGEIRAEVHHKDLGHGGEGAEGAVADQNQLRVFDGEIAQHAAAHAVAMDQDIALLDSLWEWGITGVQIYRT